MDLIDILKAVVGIVVNKEVQVELPLDPPKPTEPEPEPKTEDTQSDLLKL